MAIYLFTTYIKSGLFSDTLIACLLYQKDLLYAPLLFMRWVIISILEK